MIRRRDSSALEGPEISVVAPLFNTAAFLPELAERISETCRSQGWRHQLVLVDDHSPGGDFEVACRLAEDDPHVGVLRLRRNVGQNLAEIIGLAHASGKWMVLIDADLQDPPESIPILVGIAEKGFDAVFGARTGRYESWNRRLTSLVYKRVQALTCGVPPDAGLFVVISRSLTDVIVSEATIKSRVIPMIGASGLPLRSFPIPRSSRREGFSAYSGPQRLTSGLRTLGYALRIRRGSSQQEDPLPQDLISFRMGNLR